MAQEQTQATFACNGEIVGRGGASRIVGGRTFVLADGREVRLAAIECRCCRRRRNPVQRRAVRRQGTRSRLCFAEPQQTDRYGRVVAYAFTVRDGTEHSVQADLVATGRARVAAKAGSRACAVELLSRENTARRAKLGLWTSPYYDLVNADSPADVLAEQGHFALVEGTVVSVRESGATIYANFGRRWAEDFTVTISKRNERSFRASASNRRSSPAAVFGYADGSRNAADPGSKRRGRSRWSSPIVNDRV